MLNGNQTSCLDRRSLCKRAHEMTVTSKSRHPALGLLISLERCPLCSGSWGPWGRRVWQEDHGQCGFWCQWAEHGSEGINGPTRFGSLRCEPLLCYCSWCSTKPLPSAGQPSRLVAPQVALDRHMGFPHSLPTEMCGRRKSEGTKEGEKKRPGEVHWEEVQGRQKSNTDTNEQVERPSHMRVVCLVLLPSFQVRRGCSD